MAPAPGDSSETPVWHLDAARGPSTPSFDHLIGAGRAATAALRGRARLCRLEVDHQLNSCRLLDRKLAWLGAFENLMNLRSRWRRDDTDPRRSRSLLGVRGKWPRGHAAEQADELAMSRVGHGPSSLTGVGLSQAQDATEWVGSPM